MGAVIWLYHVVTPGIRVNSPYSIVLKISWVDYNKFRSFKVPCDVLIVWVLVYIPIA